MSSWHLGLFGGRVPESISTLGSMGLVYLPKFTMKNMQISEMYLNNGKYASPMDGMEGMFYH